MGPTVTDRLVIFDCDGVLVDSEPLANSVLARHLRAAGLPWTDAEVMARFRGHAASACVAIIGQWLSDPDGFWRAMQADTLRELAGVQPVPGVVPVLDWLAAAGRPFCVASNGDPDKMAVTLTASGLRAYQPRCFSATEVARPKPAPDLFLHAAEQMGFAPDRCVVVEDSSTGVRAAQAAGMAVFWYGGPADDPASFTAMTELPRKLETWYG